MHAEQILAEIHAKREIQERTYGIPERKIFVKQSRTSSHCMCVEVSELEIYRKEWAIYM